MITLPTDFSKPLRFSAPGFTLIELLVVVAILAILAAIAIPNLLAAQTRAKISRAKADLRTIATAMESYAVDYNAYPPDYDSGIYPGYPFAVGEYNTYRNLTTPVSYITQAPVDPFSDQGNASNRLFEYYHEDAVRTLNATSWADTWTKPGLRWYAYSFGPNKINDLLAQDQTLATDRTYDPTNGTVSPGDFGRNNLSAGQ